MVVLAAVDGESTDDEVARVGKDLASAYGDDLVVLHVMPEDQFEALNEASDRSQRHQAFGDLVRYVDEGRIQSIDVYDLEDAEEDATEVARDVLRGSVEDRDDTRTAGRVGNIVEEILDEAAESDARYIVVGGRKRTRVGKALFGSITQSVLLNADRPVVTVMEEE